MHCLHFCSVFSVQCVVCRGQCAEASWQVGIVGRGHCVVCNVGRCTECAAPVCTVQCTEFSVQRALCSVQCAVCNVRCEVWSVQCAVCSVQFAVCNVQCAEGSVQWLAWIVECAMGSARNGSVAYEVCSVHSVPLHSFLLFCFFSYFTSRLTNPIFFLPWWLIRTIT